MDRAKAEFLFGQVPEDSDLDDPEVRALLLAESFAASLEFSVDHDFDDDADFDEEGDFDEEDATHLRLVFRQIVANQIVDEDPPEVWATAQSLLAMGLDRGPVMAQLALNLGMLVTQAIAEGDQTPDTDAYVSSLGCLPLPEPVEIEETILAEVTESQPIEHDDLFERFPARLARPQYEPVLQTVAERVLDTLCEENALAYLPGGLLVRPDTLTEPITLTHRMTEQESSEGALLIDADLWPFASHTDPYLQRHGDILPMPGGSPEGRWVGPDGWLDRFAAGSLVAVRVDGIGRIHLSEAKSPQARPDLANRLRDAYEAAVAESDIPVNVDEIVYQVLAHDRTAFAAPAPPLKDLFADAGLEVRGCFVSHDESSWRNLMKLQVSGRFMNRFDADEDRQEAMAVLKAWNQEDASSEDLREAVDAMYDPYLAVTVAEALIPVDRPATDEIAAARSFAEALVGSAKSRKQIAVARWLFAVVEERSGQPLVAQQHLAIALDHDLRWPPLLDRAAWYACDRGDAQKALQLWRAMGSLAPHWLAELEPFVAGDGADLGRNEPCWCGSGRKYKHCHLGRPVEASLPDRVGWILRKSVNYLERRGGEAVDLVRELDFIRADEAGEDTDEMEGPENPVVIDTALAEGGWFEAFLDDRGPLLPDDEAIVARSWTLVDRTVYEVVDVRAGQGLTLKDLRTGESLEVRERTFSRQAEAGWMICGRAVPDGETHQFTVGIFSVPPGRESDVLDICDRANPAEICAYAGALQRPPRLTTREGEPMVDCKVELVVEDPDAAHGALDDLYQKEAGGWKETHDISEQEVILRASIRMSGATLTVTTMSEPRMDRVLDALRQLINFRVISDHREPITMQRMQEKGPPMPPGGPGLPDLAPEQMAAWTTQVQEMIEQRWLEEPVPALAGLTPREAAADPTRREQLKRLLASFPDPAGLPPGGIAPRPQRLRKELGI